MAVLRPYQWNQHLKLKRRPAAAFSFSHCVEEGYSSILTLNLFGLCFLIPQHVVGCTEHSSHELWGTAAISRPLSPHSG